ncbi:hypothetical protein AB0J40_24675 [Amycolatopsis sp. NPDC049691]|uniref:hypothetical protein n=1 Tax=Amycolatopsis sp. NPDC049691 TaxID=3155155 RepID=UPI0034270CB3
MPVTGEPPITTLLPLARTPEEPARTTTQDPPPVQRAPEPAPEPAPAPQQQQQQQHQQPETEELVKKLFDPLLRRLKTELRLDRERRGALTDRPH